MSEKEIFDYIYSITNEHYFNEKIMNNEPFGISAKEVADHLNIYRSTVSSLLNEAVKNKEFIKVLSRPVLFFPSKIIEEQTKIKLTKYEFTKEELRDLFYKKNTDKNPFSILIGYDGSQSDQVKQAKSAILYPPKGLHTLITGESGTGKTLFAHAMYNYGKAILQKNEKDYPFVEFNCADYYHNPQLLLSHLFGHIKGAFTGAEQETSGLVEKANHGILFLDEIHRLPPEGQELLFYLMDSGHYRKMGEASTTRKADVLIIGATTENPNNVLLKTFKRRIPLVINLPPLRERPIKERLKIIEYLFSNEASITQRTYIIDAEIIKAIALYEFPENIGQLSSEIKILCAQSFLDNKDKKQSEIHVPYKFLSPIIQKSYKNHRKQGYEFTGDLENYNYDLKINPSKKISHLKNEYLNIDSYVNLIDEIGNYSNQNLSRNEVAERISSTVSEYYDEILTQTYFKTIDKNEIDKIIEPDIVNFSMKIMKDVHNQLNVKISEQNVLILAFHLKFLMDRLTKNESSYDELSIKKTGDVLVDSMIDKIEEKFNIVLPNDEKNFFQQLLKNITSNTIVESEKNSKALLYILAHGRTASSIAEVCNRLLHTNYVRSFDMPLTQDVETSYNLLLKEIKSLNTTQGIMILADMGSLLQFGKRITEETGIPTHTVPNVSTAIALDFAHIMLNRKEHVDIIYNEYLIKNHLKNNTMEASKPYAIISTCSSGKGTSLAFQTAIEELLNENNMNFIKVFTFMNSELQLDKDEYEKILKEYNVLAIVGNIHLNVNIPFFHITELLTMEKRKNFVEFIQKNIKNVPEKNFENKSDEDEIIGFLSKHVLYVNPFTVEKHADIFLNTLFSELNYYTDDFDSLKFSLILHIGFMIERIITNKNIIFDNKDEYISKHQKCFDTIKDTIKDLEDTFEIEISDDEICYIIMTLYPEN